MNLDLSSCIFKEKIRKLDLNGANIGGDSSYSFMGENNNSAQPFFALEIPYAKDNFYPDYIIQLKNGDVWIIEAKGGMTADGSSNNIDKYAPRKFDALKEYASRHPEIKWGFVRAVGTQIYLSNTEWSEDVTNRNVWKPIEVFI